MKHHHILNDSVLAAISGGHGIEGEACVYRIWRRGKREPELGNFCYEDHHQCFIRQKDKALSGDPKYVYEEPCSIPHPVHEDL